MAWGTWVQSTAAVALTLVLGWRGVAALAAPPGEDPRHPAIRETAWLAVAAWAFGRPRAWRGRGAVVWGWGAVASTFHVAVAFHAGHGWSHGAAYRHTEEVSGVGAGVFVNYAFVTVWVADAAWLATSPESYRRRPGWVAWGAHGFLAFVVVNAAVVFASDWRVGLLGAVVIAFGAAWERRNRRARGRPSPGSGGST